MKHHLKESEIETEKLQAIEDESNVRGIADQRVNTINEPTIQDDLHGDGTIKDIKVENVIEDYGDLPSDYLINLGKENVIKNQKK